MVMGRRSTPFEHDRAHELEREDDVYLELVDDLEVGSTRINLPFAAIGPRTLELKIHQPVPWVRTAQAFAKRSIDVLVAAISLLAAAPIMFAIALAIKLDSKGPVFYRHPRIGRRGRPIMVWKFRSMRTDMTAEELEEAIQSDADRIDSPVYKSPRDPRITGVGRFIRQYGFDELPQFFNVLGGSMSLVGPRPLVDEEVAELSPVQYAYRNSVPPGITGLWQVFRRAETSFDERIRLDLLYVGCRSMWLDFYLLLMTPLALVKGDRSF